MKRTLLEILFFALFGAAITVYAQQQDTLPKRDPMTVDDLFTKLGRCNVGLADEQAYTQKLVQRIRELETALKAKSN